MRALTRVRLASTAEDRFAAHVESLTARIDQQPDEAVAAMLRDLDAARRQVLTELVSAQGYGAARLSSLSGELQDVMDAFVEKYGTAVEPAQTTLFDAGEALAAEPLVRAGLMLHVPQLNRRLLEAAQDYQASLITSEADAAVGQISAALRLGVLRGQSMLETAQDVAGSLSGPGVFGTLANRAEAITRTELGRIQSIATQAGLADAQQYVPDLQKQWRHSGNTGKWARLGHIEANDQVQDVTAKFHVRPAPGLPYEDLLYPRDPNASAKSTVNCGCLSIPYRAAWAGALAA